MADDVLDARVEQGIELLTAHLSRDASSGFMDEGLFRAVLGHGLTDDDLILAMSNMLIAAELVMLTYQTKTGTRPIEVLQEVAAFRQQRRSEE